VGLKEIAKAAEALQGLLTTTPEEDFLVMRVWERLRAKLYYAAEGCLQCRARFNATGNVHAAWLVNHAPGCNVPLLQVTEELAVRTVVRWFTARKLSPLEDLPLVAAMLVDAIDGVGRNLSV
jgi:hypothetical protein